MLVRFAVGRGDHDFRRASGGVVGGHEVFNWKRRDAFHPVAHGGVDVPRARSVVALVVTCYVSDHGGRDASWVAREARVAGRTSLGRREMKRPGMRGGAGTTRGGGGGRTRTSGPWAFERDARGERGACVRRVTDRARGCAGDARRRRGDVPGRRSGARLSLIDVARRLGRPRVAVFSNRLTSVSTNTSLPDVRLADGSPRALPPPSHPTLRHPITAVSPGRAPRPRWRRGMGGSAEDAPDTGRTPEACPRSGSPGWRG